MGFVEGLQEAGLERQRIPVMERAFSLCVFRKASEVFNAFWVVNRRQSDPGDLNAALSLSTGGDCSQHGQLELQGTSRFVLNHWISQEKADV